MSTTLQSPGDPDRSDRSPHASNEHLSRAIEHLAHAIQDAVEAWTEAQKASVTHSSDLRPVIGSLQTSSDALAAVVKKNLPIPAKK